MSFIKDLTGVVHDHYANRPITNRSQVSAALQREYTDMAISPAVMASQASSLSGVLGAVVADPRVPAALATPVGQAFLVTVGIAGCARYAWDIAWRKPQLDRAVYALDQGDGLETPEKTSRRITRVANSLGRRSYLKAASAAISFSLTAENALKAPPDRSGTAMAMGAVAGGAYAYGTIMDRIRESRLLRAVHVIKPIESTVPSR